MAVVQSNAEELSHSGSRAIVIGGGLAGLASARVLSDLFDEVILLERDAITQQASFSQQTVGSTPSGSPLVPP